MKPGAHRRAMAGVGLIEVLITLVIIAGGVMAMSRLQGLLLTSAASSRQMSDASFIAQQVIENLRARDWSDNSLVASGPNGDACITGSSGRLFRLLPDVERTTATYCVQYTVIEEGATGQMQFKTVQVTVSWTDAQGQPRAYTASTRLQRIGANLSARLLS